MMDWSGKTRAISTESDIADVRHQLFTVGFDCISDAIQHYYFFEGVCLLQSLFAARMESREGDHFEACPVS